MRRRWVVGAVVGIATSALLMVINKNDFDRTPATDTADVVATWAVVGGAVLWFALRRLGDDRRFVAVSRAAFGGIAIGALLTGLTSVFYDPWAT